MARIHATAIVDSAACVADTAVIGPYCVVEGPVELGEDVELTSHVVVGGRTRIGARSRVFPFASVGLPPQDMKYKGEASELVVGEDCVIREHVTINPGTAGGGMLTRVGNKALLAIGCHIAHDCLLGDNVLVMNHVLLGGHVTIGDCAVLGGGSAIHQHVRLGANVMVGGLSGVENDVIPFGTVMGNRARLEGLNIVGMKRRGYSREEIHTLRAAYREMFGEGEKALAERLDGIAVAHGDSRAVKEVIAFLRQDSTRGLCRPLSLHDF